MRKSIPIIMLLILVIMICLPVFAQEHEEGGKLEYRASTEGVSGFSLILVNLYNDHRLVYAVVSTLSMAILGGLIAVLVDFILARFGLTVSKMEHRE
jgi:ABC-type Fe3+ transport system permease subunit